MADFLSGFLGGFAGGSLGGGAIGAATVKLLLDTGTYDKQLDAAHVQTVSSTNSMGSSFAGLSSLTTVALGTAGIALAKFAADSVGAAIEANEAHLKLQNTFENNASLADSSVDAFERQADALRDLTGVDDEAIVGAQALLGQFKLTGTQVQQLIPRIVDLSTKMGIDLEAAAKAVGKATQGTTGGLQRYGLQVDTAAAKSDAFGATLDALGKVEGFAAAQADEEPWRLLSARWEEVQERVGQGLIPVLVKLSESLVGLGSPARTLSDEFLNIALQNEALATAFRDDVDDVASLGPTFDYVREKIVGFIGKMKGAADATTNFAGLSRKSIHDVRTQAVEDFDAMGASLTSVSRKFDLTSDAAVRATRIVADKQQEMADDLKKLDKLKIGDELKNQLLQLGPDMVHAFVTGNKNQREAIRNNLKDYDKAVEDTAKAVKTLAYKGGQETGTQLMQGTIQGIVLHSEGVAEAARAAVAQAIAAARKEAEAQSPSKKMATLGGDMIAGLVDGIESQRNTLIGATTKTIDDLVKAAEKSLQDAKNELSKVLGQAGGFSSGISGGFSSFLDISGAFGLGGADIGNFFQTQLQGATQFADILKALQTQGASQALLSQIAQAGPQSIPFAQQLLQQGPDAIAAISDALSQIQDLAQATAKGLTEVFFGQKIDELKDEVRQLRQEVRDLGHVQIVLDGEQLTAIIRKNANVHAKVNAGVTGF